MGLHLWSSGAQDVCNQSVTGRLRGSVGDQNAERNVEGRSLDNEVSEGSKAESEARLEAIWVYILSKDLTFLCWCPESLGEAKF